MAKNNGEKNKSGKKDGTSSLLGWGLWLLAAIILIIIFVANQKKITSNLKTTGFFDRLFGKTPAFIENAEVTESTEKNDVEAFSSDFQIAVTAASSELGGESGVSYYKDPTVSSRPKNENPSFPAADDAEAEQAYMYAIEGDGSAVPDIYDTQDLSVITAQPVPKPNPATPADAVTTAPVQSPIADPQAVVNLKLYFISLTPDGTLLRNEVVRTMKKSDTPLTDAINALIDGPTQAETQAYGCQTLVSSGTRLLGSSIKNGVATLNFSEQFEFNQYGIEGLIGELQQIVFTATAFSTVESVQFLIEGVHRDFLGEGVKISVPLTRNSF